MSRHWHDDEFAWCPCDETPETWPALREWLAGVPAREAARAGRPPEPDSIPALEQMLRELRSEKRHDE